MSFNKYIISNLVNNILTYITLTVMNYDTSDICQ